MSNYSRRFFLKFLTFGGGTSLFLAACGQNSPTGVVTGPGEAATLVRGLGSFSVAALLGGAAEEVSSFRTPGDGIAQIVVQGLASDQQFFYRFIAPEPGSFPQGVFSGDPTETGAIVATRFVPSAGQTGSLPLTLEISAQNDFGPVAGVASPVGRFRTLGGGSVKFIHISCANENPYPIGQALRAEVASSPVAFVVFNGDTVYADRFWLGQLPEPSLDFYRSLYRDQRDPNYAGEGFASLYGEVAFVANWDDHEIINDYSGQGTVGGAVQTFFDPASGSSRTENVGDLQRLGYKAFFDYTPVTPPSLMDAASVDPNTRVFRRTRASANADVFSLDLRQYRAPEAGGPLVPILPPGLTPEILAAQLQLSPTQAAQFFGPPGFQSNLRTENRTLLGRAQMDWLKAGLRDSTAAFKFIVSEFIFTEYYVLPYDRWEGYWQERQELLSFIQANNIQGVVFLTGDAHSGWINRVNAGPDVWEVVTGPTGSSTLARNIASSGQDVQQFYGTVNSFLAPVAAGGVPGVSAESLQFLELDTPNYMSIEVSGGQAVIQIKDAGGGVVTDPLGRRGELIL